MASSKNEGLTDKQELFCQHFVRTGNAALAYRIAYEKGEEARDEWHYVSACQMLDRTKVRLRIEELQGAARKRGEYTVSKVMDELEEARVLAMAEAQPSGAVSAIKEKVKISGLDKPQKVSLTDDKGNPLLALLANVSENGGKHGKPRQ